GVNALYPVVGTALIIVGGRHSGSIVNRLLSSRIPIFVGLLSYSLYLWHWPVFAVARYLRIEFTFSTVALLVGVVFGLAYISYRFIESPMIRSKMQFKNAFVLFFCVP